MKKAFHIIGILLVLLAAVFALPGCAEKDVRPLYTVTFISAEGETVKTDKVRRGDEVDAPEQQQRPGYTAYWADEEGNRTAFPKIVTGDETYYLKYSPSLVKDAYITEYYFENDDGQFLIDDSLTKSYDMPLNTVVRIYPGQFDGYEFDENNRFNVLSGTTQPGVTVTLRAYYRQKRITVSYYDGDTMLKSGEVVAGKAFSADAIAPEKEGKRFVYWSLTPDGAPYEFLGSMEDISLYAVYTEDEIFDVEIQPYAGAEIEVLSHDAPEGNGVYSVRAGDEFVFVVRKRPGTSGEAFVRAEFSENGNVYTREIHASANGEFSFVVTGNATLTIQGLTAGQYQVTIMLAMGEYDEKWAAPYDFSQDLYLIADNGISVTTHKGAVSNRTATFALESGSYDALLCTMKEGEYVPVSENFSFTAEGESPAFFVDGEIYLVNRTLVSGEESVAESGDVFTEQGKVDMLFTGAHFGTSDYAVTVALRQLFDNGKSVPHGDAAEASPDIGFYFIAPDGSRAELTMYDVGNTVIATADGQVEKYAALCTAGAILGRPEWEDCYRYARLTYIKSGERFYVLFSGDGEGGGVMNDGQAFAPTTAVAYDSYLMYYIDLKEGVAYYNVNRLTNQYETAAVSSAAKVLANVQACGFSMDMAAGGKTYARIYGYGFTTDKTVIDGMADNINTAVSISADGANIYYNGEHYDGKTHDVPLFSSAIIEVELPDGKIVEKFTDNGRDADFTIDGGKVVYAVYSSGSGGMRQIDVTFKDGLYTDSTSVFITAKAAASVPGEYDSEHLSARFTNADTGETRYGKTVEEGVISVVLPRGKWTAYVSNGYLSCDAFEVVSGEGLSMNIDVLLDKSAAADNTAISNGGLIYNEKDNALHINANNYMQQDSDVGGVTFVPNSQILEFGYTLTGMTPCNAATYYYPFLGMYVRDETGGWMRFVNREDGGYIGFMLRDDFNSRTLISLPGDEKPFYTATGGYSWANDKPWIQNRTYRLDVKVKVDGYNISVYVRTGESLKNGKNWTAVFPDDNPINVYDWYNSSDAAQTGIRSQYLSTLYSLDGRCHFGITARRDNGHTDDIAFSGIWYIISER